MARLKDLGRDAGLEPLSRVPDSEFVRGTRRVEWVCVDALSPRRSFWPCDATAAFG